MNFKAVSSAISMLLLYAVIQCHTIPASVTFRSSPLTTASTDISFVSPDLVVYVDVPEGNYRLQAYSSIENEGILKEMKGTDGELKSELASGLRWHSVGRPVPIYTDDEGSPDEKIIRWGLRRFFMQFNMLTASHIKLLAKAASEKHRVNVTEKQIVPLNLDSFVCSFRLHAENDEELFYKGTVEDFYTSPMTMDFPLKPDSKEDTELRKQIVHSDPKYWPKLKCSMAARAKTPVVNKLEITSQQVDEIGLTEKLFGDSGKEQKDQVYVTRDQMAELSREMYATLNIVEEYEMPEWQFDEAFITSIIQQTAASSFRNVPIDEALGALSKYTIDISQDLSPDEIKRELSNILKVVTVGNKDHTVADNERKQQRVNESEDSGSETENTIESGNALNQTNDSGTEQSSVVNKTGTHSETARERENAFSKYNKNTRESDKFTRDVKSKKIIAIKEDSGSAGVDIFGVKVGASGATKRTSGRDMKTDKTKREQQKTSNTNSEAGSQGSKDHNKNVNDNLFSADEMKSKDQRYLLKEAFKNGMEKTSAFVKKNRERTFDELKSLDDQLKELNRMNHDHIQWQFDGNKVVPKSINVARVVRGKFKKTLRFNRVKIEKREATFIHNFAVQISDAIPSKPLFEQFNSRLTEFNSILTEFNSILTEFNSSMTSSMTGFNSRLNDLSGLVNTSRNDAGRLSTRLSDLSNGLDRKVRNSVTNIREDLTGKVNEVKNAQNAIKSDLSKTLKEELKEKADRLRTEMTAADDAVRQDFQKEAGSLRQNLKQQESRLKAEINNADSKLRQYVRNQITAAI